MTKLEAFRQANPDLTILEISDPAFAQYGVKYDYPLEEIEQVMARVEMPAKGSSYLQKIPALEKTAGMFSRGCQLTPGPRSATRMTFPLLNTTSAQN